MQLDRLPLLPNGKLNRAGLPDPQIASDSGTPYAAPDNEAGTDTGDPVEAWH